MAMLVEPSRSEPAWPLSTTDVPTIPRAFPVVARPNGVPGAEARSAGVPGADARRADQPLDVCQSVDVAGAAASPLRAAVMAACAKRHAEPGFIDWLREVVRSLDDPAS